MFSLTYAFEALPLVQQNGLFAEITATGRAEIEYAEDGGWCVDRIFVAAHNGKAFLDPDYAEGEIEIERGIPSARNPWWDILHAALMTRWDAIEEQVALALADEGKPLPGLDDGNRLGAHELGLLTATAGGA